MGLHKFAYGCNFTDQLDYMYCVNVRSVHLVMTWFSTMKKKREREKLLKSKKNCILLQEFLFKMNSSTNFEIWSHLLKFLVFALLLRLIVNDKT